MSRRPGAAAAALLVLLPGCAAPRSDPVPARIGIAAEPAATLAPGTPARPVPSALVPPTGFQEAVEAGTRTATGAPGPRYWSQWADYRLTASLDTGRKRLSGTARI